MENWKGHQFEPGRPLDASPRSTRHPDAGEKPSGQLGEPSARRRKKSTEGFHVENLASDISVSVAKNGKSQAPRVSRSVERTPFTLPAQRTRVSEEEVERAIRLKRAPDVMAKLTAIDRMLGDNEFRALAWYVQAHHKRETGSPSRMRYDDTPRGLIESEEDAETRRILTGEAMNYVDDRLPEAHRAFLDLLTFMMFPSMREGTPPSKIDVGRNIIKTQGRDRAEGGFEAYVRCVAQGISDYRGEWAIEYRRRVEAKELRKSDERKKQAAKLFDEVTR